MYRVIKAFSDYQDNNYVYWAGDEYPRVGLEVTNDRIRGLLGTNNKQGVPLIAGELPKEAEELQKEEKPVRKTRKK